MQYLDKLGDDLKPGYSTYVLNYNSDKISFFAYTGNTAISADKQCQQINDSMRGYFLRKGFSDAITAANPNVVTPMYRDNEGKEVHLRSSAEAKKLIYEGKINICGFSFAKDATDAQKEEAFGKIINTFVSASKNLDFSSEQNLFVVNGKFSRVIYNNGGSEKMKINGADVQERLDLNTRDVVVNKVMRERMKKFDRG